jgi:hypothetical protein
LEVVITIVETSRWCGVCLEGCLDFVLRVWFFRLTASTILIFVISQAEGAEYWDRELALSLGLSPVC